MSCDNLLAQMFEPSFPKGSSGGTDDHTALSNRDLPAQHPIAAITGLQAVLDTIPQAGTFEGSTLTWNGTVEKWKENTNIISEKYSAIKRIDMLGGSLIAMQGYIDNEEETPSWTKIDLKPQGASWNGYGLEISDVGQNSFKSSTLELRTAAGLFIEGKTAINTYDEPSSEYKDYVLAIGKETQGDGYILGRMGDTDKGKWIPLTVENITNFPSQIGQSGKVLGTDGTSLAWITGGGGGGVTVHSDLTGRELADQHPISAITGLTEALAGKAATADIPTKLSELEKDINFNDLYNTKLEITTALDGKANTEHTQTIASVTGLQEALNAWEITAQGKADKAAFETAIAQIETSLSGKASTVHAHTLSEITDFPSQTDQSGKALVTNGTTTYWATIGGGGSDDHNLLTNREMAGQHPITAITGLAEALAGKATSADIPTKLSELEKDINFDDLYNTKLEITTALGTKADTVHAHAIADVTDLQAALDGKAVPADIPTKLSDLTKDINFDDLYNTKLEITTALGLKADKEHTQKIETITDFPSMVGADGKVLSNDGNALTWVASGGGSSDHATLSNRNTADQHTISAITGLDTALAGKADTAHNQTIATITDFPAQTGNAGKVLATNGATLAWKTEACETLKVETLSGTKTLTAADATVQLLGCSSNREVILPTTGLRIGQQFIFKNINAYNSSNKFEVTAGGNGLDNVYAQGRKAYVWDGSSWRSAEPGSGDSTNLNYGGVNTVIGKDANAYQAGTAFGKGANGSIYGAAVGHTASAVSYGAAVGYYANAGDYGAAIGMQSNTSNKSSNTAALNAYAKAERNREVVFSHTDNTTNKSNTSIQGIKEKAWTDQGGLGEVFLDASSARLVLINNSVLNFQLKFSAINADASYVKTWVATGAIKNVGGTVSLVGTPTVTVLAMDSGAESWTIVLSADTTNKSLKLEFQGAAGQTITTGGSYLMTDVRI